MVTLTTNQMKEIRGGYPPQCSGVLPSGCEVCVYHYEDADGSCDYSERRCQAADGHWYTESILWYDCDGW